MNGILVTAKDPVPIVPNVPTVASIGYPEDEIHLWHTILVKDGTQPEIVKIIENALKRMPESTEFSAYLKSASVEWDFMPGEEFAPQAKAEMAKIKNSLDMLKPKK